MLQRLRILNESQRKAREERGRLLRAERQRRRGLLKLGEAHARVEAEAADEPPLTPAEGEQLRAVMRAHRKAIALLDEAAEAAFVAIVISNMRGRTSFSDYRAAVEAINPRVEPVPMPVESAKSRVARHYFHDRYVEGFKDGW